MQSKPRQARRILQFSLRGLFLLILLVAVFFGGRASTTHLIKSERTRAEAAERKAQQAELMSKRSVALQLVAEYEREAERQAWQRERTKLESLDWSEAAKRRKQDLDRLQRAVEQDELRRRLETKGIQLP